MPPKLIIHLASLYYWFDDYEAHLDDRIHAALDAGLDGVEISNGPSILAWQPAPETIERLKDKLVTIHAETGPAFGVSLYDLTEAILRLPLEVANVTFHPDELTPNELRQLNKLPFPASIENMDARRTDWRTAGEVRPAIYPGVGFTFDTAHAEENGLALLHYTPMFAPVETHLSIPNKDYYGEWGYNTGHALTQFRPDEFPQVPSACPIVTLEGLVPPDMGVLREEVRFVRGRLGS